MIAPGRIWWADVDKRRPVVIVSGDDVCDLDIGEIQVLPLTRSLRRTPAHVFVPSTESGLGSDSVAVTTQVATINRAQLVEVVGTVDSKTLAQMQLSLRHVFGL